MSGSPTPITSHRLDRHICIVDDLPGDTLIVAHHEYSVKSAAPRLLTDRSEGILEAGPGLLGRRP